MTTLTEQRQAAYEAGNKKEVARLNAEIMKGESKQPRTLAEMLASAKPVKR